jgi:hypothetical protein
VCLLVLGVAPVLLVVAARDPVLIYALPVLLVFLSIVGPIAIIVLGAQHRGLRFTALRGGPDAAVEIRSRQGGTGLVLPLASAKLHWQRYGSTMRKVEVAEAVARTGAGEVMFARGGNQLDPDLVRWLKRLAAANGSAAASPDALDIDDIAALAASDPLHAPPGIEVVRDAAWPTYRCRSVLPRGKAILPLCFSLATFLLLPVCNGHDFSFAGVYTWVIPLELMLLYWVLLCGPLTAEWEVRGPMLLFRRKRFGLTLWIWSYETSSIGLYLCELPAIALQCGGSLVSFNSPDAEGPDVAAMVWLAASIRASEGQWQSAEN